MGNIKKNNALIIASNLCNIGDYVLLLQAVEGLRRYCNVEDVTITQWEKLNDFLISELESKNISVISAKSPRAFLKTYSIVIFPGGQVVRDNASLLSLIIKLITVTITKLCGARQASIGIGISPVKKKTVRLIWKFIFQLQDVITFRDERSLSVFNSFLSSNSKGIKTSDLVFLDTTFHEKLNKNQYAQTIVIAPCNDATENRFIIEELLVQRCANVSEELNIKHFTILAHDPRPDVDLNFCKKLALRLEETIEAKVVLVGSNNLDEYLSVYRNAAIVITNRLHSVIFSLIANKRVVVIDDGNVKLLEVVKEFAIPLISQTKHDSIPFQTVSSYPYSQEANLYRKRKLGVLSSLAEQNFMLLSKIIN